MVDSRDQAVGGPSNWSDTSRILSGRDRASLTARELDLLADAMFWSDRLHESISARGAAHRRYLDEGETDGAAMAAWRLFYEHWLVGDVVVGRSWLERARSLVADAGSRPAGWLSIADADVAMAASAPGTAVECGRHAVEVGELTGDPDLAAMALQAAGRAHILSGEIQTGLGMLDRAMISVIGNELTPHYTGWVYCNVIAACHSIADLRRANEWCEAALRWCDSLQDGLLYPGLCRVYSAELAVLRGDWNDAEAAAKRACEELVSHDERYAGAAHYTVGEVARLHGSFREAEESYEQAHRLGFLPEPGLALVRFAEGDTAGALRALRSALQPGPSAPLPRAQLLSALMEVAVASGEAEMIEFAEAELVELAGVAESRVVESLAESAAGWAAEWRDMPDRALVHMRVALDGFRELRMPYECARERVRIGILGRRMGDEVTSRMEFATAMETFEQLGAMVDARFVAELTNGFGVSPVGGAASSGLTNRELEVLRLAADGNTNRQIADALFLSPHTVARHLGNIYTKLGVGSRAAATAWAYERGLIGGTGA